MSQDHALAVVIPVWNLPDDLARLLDQIAQMGIFSQVIVADDGSDQSCDPAALGFDAGRLGAQLIYLRSPMRRGAGHARNAGLKAVTAGNLLFFDADDRLAPDLPLIWQQHLDADRPDFTMFRHSDTRVLEAEGRVGSFATDEARWDKAMGDRNIALLTPSEAAGLCLVSNYPWNKFYRTDFLRDAGITCSQTPVHNDIRLHWLSFLRAQRIQADRRIGAVHVIGARDHHLTTQRGAERLCLAEVFQDVTQTLQATPGKHNLMSHFIQFVDDLCRWNLNQVDDSVLPAFRQLAIDAYMRFRPEEFRLFSEWRPLQADAMVAFLLKEGV